MKCRELSARILLFTNILLFTTNFSFSQYHYTKRGVIIKNHIVQINCYEYHPDSIGKKKLRSISYLNDSGYVIKLLELNTPDLLDTDRTTFEYDLKGRPTTIKAIIHDTIFSDETFEYVGSTTVRRSAFRVNGKTDSMTATTKRYSSRKSVMWSSTSNGKLHRKTISKTGGDRIMYKEFDRSKLVGRRRSLGVVYLDKNGNGIRSTMKARERKRKREYSWAFEFTYNDVQECVRSCSTYSEGKRQPQYSCRHFEYITRRGVKLVPQ